MNERWYDKTVSQVEEKLNTDINTGLSPSVLRGRKKNDEMNIIYPIKHYSFEACVKKIAYGAKSEIKEVVDELAYKKILSYE